MLYTPKYLLDSRDPLEYKKIAELAKNVGQILWGGTTNPSLIAKKLSGKKVSAKKAYELQKKIVFEILDIVPGAVSAEVYADEKTSAEEMVSQGREIASWHKRMYVKLPTTVEGLKARTILRKENIAINNTLVFSLEQVFAISMHERLLQDDGKMNTQWPMFISPFVGRLDDRGDDGMMLIEESMKMKNAYAFSPWILESSVRNISHMQRGIEAKTDIFTAPANVYQEWFSLNGKHHIDSSSYAKELKPIPSWKPTNTLLTISTVKELFNAIEKGNLDISHPLTTAGVEKFASDWHSIIQSDL